MYKKTHRKIKGQFIHQVDNCNNQANPEINCTEYIEFISDSTVFFDGGDIGYRTNYNINDNKVIFEKSVFVNYEISLNIPNRQNLICIEDNEVWKKD